MRVGLRIRVGIKMRLRLEVKVTERCTPRSRIPLENLSVSSCDWSLWCQQGGGGEGGGEHLREEEWDLIIGSDLIYNEAGVHMLPQVFKGLLSSGRATAYYCHTKHRCLHPSTVPPWYFGVAFCCISWTNRDWVIFHVIYIDMRLRNTREAASDSFVSSHAGLI